jgi:diguanylate cyclase (GGDEF)-like protein
MGHKVGDKALVHIAKVMLSNFRDSDIIGWLGGDEFGIILPKANEQNAAAKARQIVANLEKKPLVIDGKKIYKEFILFIQD